MSSKALIIAPCELTRRQREVVEQIAKSETTKAIALNLGVSEKAVEYHRTQVYRRLGIFDTAAVTRYALYWGLVNADFGL